MRTRTALWTALLTAGAVGVGLGAAVAQPAPGGMGPGMMEHGAGPGMMHGGQGPGMTGPGTGPQMQGGPEEEETMGPGAMGPGMMQGSDDSEMPRPGMGDCMMRGGRSGMMGPGMMRGGMMRGGMHGGMMHGGMMHGGMMHGGMEPGMGALFGSRVTQVMNLSVDDVRAYLAVRLQHLNNKRLRIGDVEADGDTITADIVTVDNSLVQRLKVDRHTGDIQYED